MDTKLRDLLKVLNDSPVFWAGVTSGFVVIAALTVSAALFSEWVVIAGMLPVWQWGYTARAEVERSGILCDECGDRLDADEDPRTEAL